jgi:hypothetical protein
MAVRVSETEVRQIITTTFDSLNPFIIAANFFVNAVLSGEGFTEAYLKQIELWAAAHFVCIADPRLKEKRIGDAQEQYNVPWVRPESEGLHTTYYGRMAIMLDTSGVLSRQGKRKIVIQNINSSDRTHDGTWSAS